MSHVLDIGNDPSWRSVFYIDYNILWRSAFYLNIIHRDFTYFTLNIWSAVTVFYRFYLINVKYRNAQWIIMTVTFRILHYL